MAGVSRYRWLVMAALAVMAVGTLAAIADQIYGVTRIQNSQIMSGQFILFTGAVFVAPILLGVAALRTKVIPLWMAIYPIVAVAVRPVALFTLLSNAAGASVVVIL